MVYLHVDPSQVLRATDDLDIYSRPAAKVRLWHKTDEEEVKRGNLLLETRTCGYVTAECGLTWIKVSFMHT